MGNIQLFFENGCHIFYMNLGKKISGKLVPGKIITGKSLN